LVNFFSLYCVFKALQSFQGHTAYYWMLNNIGVVLLSTLVSVLVFKRKLDNYNYIGLGLAIFAIVLLNI
jgi:multidrug transporter EmrE-like cation transporter